jgi:hypothetical protein
VIQSGKKGEKWRKTKHSNAPSMTGAEKPTDEQAMTCYIAGLKDALFQSAGHAQKKKEAAGCVFHSGTVSA